MVRVALDAAGGDHGLEATVAGAATLSCEDNDIHVILVGDNRGIADALERLRYDPARLTVCHADGAVTMADEPRAALDRLPRCSIAVAAELVRDGAADALVSAGNTGATILAAATTFERLPGIRRAALAAVYPTEQRHGPRRDPFALMLDVGATLTATADDLAAFAVMGAAYSAIVSEIGSPRVALLSNGTEASKGTPEIVEAHARLRASALNFVGNVEGLDIPRGSVDVIVCGGFLGNVVLKMLEGVSDVFVDIARQAAGRKLQWRVGLAMLGGGLRELHRLTDWKGYGGAPLLGLDRVVIKAHGRSEARAIRNALKVAAKTARGDLIGRIRAGTASLTPPSADRTGPPGAGGRAVDGVQGGARCRRIVRPPGRRRPATA
ncbi:MAG: phosphate acyltransferase PlsX, partial [Myxococcota bacterium]